MATRFYFDPTNTPDVSPDFTGQWTSTSGAVRRKLVIDNPGNNANTLFERTEESTTQPYKILCIQFVSEPLDSISATLSACKTALRCIEDAAASNSSLGWVIGKCDEDGSNIEYVGYQIDTTEFDDAAYTNRFLGTYDKTDLTFSQGDRLIVEIGIHFDNKKTTAYTSGFYVTDNHATTDLPENDTETTAYNSWIETGDTFTVASGEAGWAGKVSGVASADISKIMGVAIADIAKVGGV